MTKYSTLYFEEQAARKKTQRELEEVNQKLEEADRKLAQMREFIRETGQSGTFLLWVAPKYGIEQFGRLWTWCETCTPIVKLTLPRS